MKLTKEQKNLLTTKNIINYMVDCLGHSEVEATKILSLNGHTYLTDKELKECIEFSK